MLIKKTIELEDGTYEITGVFTDAEVEIIIEAGLNLLLQNGALPFVASEEDEDVYIVTPPSDLKQ